MPSELFRGDKNSKNDKLLHWIPTSEHTIEIIETIVEFIKNYYENCGQVENCCTLDTLGTR